jgi:cytochrome c
MIKRKRMIMQLKMTVLILGTVATVWSSLQASETAEALFDAKCAMCHSKARPADMNKVVAPALMGIMRHVKIAYPQKVNAVSFMVDYVLDPQEAKAICMPKKIQRFGLMPSQKGNVTEAQLLKITAWMFDHFPPAGFQGMGQGLGKGQGR